MTANFSVEIGPGGRGGDIVYREPGVGEYRTWWELACGNGVLAFVCVPPPTHWDAQVPWANGRRDEVLTRIASEIIGQKAAGYSYEIGDGFITSSVPRAADKPAARRRPPDDR